ncbi:TonB-dependent receptor [uncultured Paludibaculum sp.]|uniref:TonB-dependent receptor n=1 Tax=uncultured Paludibaculum sp. TaxID=1765020 RepID=UPI002AAB2967|nr:TonB-dependent receptor [uncultured Paludibaculum sp.]
MRLLSYFVVALLLCGETLSAQSFQGSLRGRLTDESGAAVPDAKVTLRDQATGATRSTLTSNAGEYSFPSLDPATYSVTAQAAGFKTMEKASVVVATQSAVTVDLTLPLGQVTESVNVTEEVPLIETANASTGQVIDRQKLEDLPNLGRNPFMMSKLSQNVVQVGNPKFNRMQDQSGSSQISIAGGPVRGNNYLLDGISITDSTNRAVIIPSLEAVQEVKVQANTYDAEMGRTGGGTFNTFLKSGSNRMHGSAFGYLRETEWLANNFFSNRAGQPRIDQPFRNYGGSIGGPIRIPKVYDGRNKTFFWISGEAYRQTEAAGTALSVPTAAELAGNFSQSKSQAGGLQLMYDPLTSRTENGSIVRDVFAGNIIPANRLSKVGTSLAAYYPAPTRTAAFYGDTNFDSTVGAYNRADQTTWKVDHQITQWWRASASYLHYGSREPGNAWFPNIASPGQGVLYRKVDATQLNSTLTPSPTIVVAIRYGFNRFPNFSAPTSFGFDMTKLGFSQSLISQLPVYAFPSVTMSDLVSYGGGGVSQNVFHSRTFSASLAKFSGRHSWKFGFDYRVLNHDGSPTVTPGSYSFSDVFTRATPTKTTAGTGSALSALLLGYPASGSATLSTNVYNYVRYYAGFVQDDFRVNSKLTLNLGLRYEYETGIADRNNNFIVGFDPNKTNPLQANVTGLTLPGVVMYAGLNGNPTRSGDPNKNKFSPRIGVAYSLDSKTTLRGGYGMFWAPIPFSLQDPIGYTQSTPMVTSIDNNATPTGSLDNPFPTGLLKPVGNAAGELAGIGQGISAYDLKARSTLVQQYSFDIQRQMPGGVAMALGYVGSKSTHLVQGTGNININQLASNYLSLGSALNQSVANPMAGNGGQFAVASATITQSQLLRPFPEFTTVNLVNSDTSRALYHSLFLRGQKRFASGMSFLATYTWSLNQDSAFSGAGNVYSGQAGTAQNNYDLESEYGLSTSHTPHRLSTAVTYELPFGKGKTYLTNSRVLDYAVGGWSVNVVGTLQSGFPLAITQVNNNGVIGTSVQRPNATGSSPVTSGALTDRLDNYIDKAAFSQAGQFTFGNVSRTIPMRGPGQINWDVSMFKTFQITELFKAQFRAEALNFTNTPMFYGPNTQFGNVAFGRITSQANFSRMIQLGVRFLF